MREAFAIVRAEAYLDGCVLRTKPAKNVPRTKAPQNVPAQDAPGSGVQVYRDELVRLSGSKEARQ